MYYVEVIKKVLEVIKLDINQGPKALSYLIYKRKN